MYVIIVYDVEQKRVSKMCKKLREYLIWIQNSVFEGEITEGKLVELKSEINRIINKDNDSVIIFEFSSDNYIKRRILGKEFNPTDNIL
ncbi:MAG: CRISPR-associated endonuclease Cas2 [Veillonellaceae bacterium]|nr:CRISPR-associated endonuclease Cas2 [Veillonellaceae bacterium]